jgi:hypothetical protein
VRVCSGLEGYLNLEEILGRSIELLERLLACVRQGLHLEIVDGQAVLWGLTGVRALLTK